MVRVFLSDHLKDVKNIEKIAVGLAIFEQSKRISYPYFFGHYGQFENNPRTEFIHKLHIANINGLISDNWQSKRGYQRKSDHFVVYCEHWLDKEDFQLLQIVTPNAHSRINGLITDLLDKAEQFYALSKSQLDLMQHYTANDIRADKIKTTE